MHAVLYYLGLACLFTHELDAVTHSEWRLLLGLRDLDQLVASEVFVALHVPLFFAILWLSHHSIERVRAITRTIVASFLVIHAVLHFALSGRPEYDFLGVLSQLLVFSSAGFGLAYLCAHYFQVGSSDAPQA